MLRSFKMASESVAKRARTSGPLIGTHNGHFHADEALAVYMLRLLPTYASADLVRTRDPTILAECHTVVDVGGVYDHSSRRYDHHQREFDTKFPGHNTKLSSAGLVFKDLGESIISQQTSFPEKSDENKILYEKMYTDFIEAFDANDNGISKYDPKELEKANIQPQFNDGGFSIASVVGSYNYGLDTTPASTDPQDQTNGVTTEKTSEQLKVVEDEHFQQASQFVGTLFAAKLRDYAANWMPARALVREAFFGRKTEELDPKGRIVRFNEGAPWHDHLFAAEEEEGSVGNVLYVLFPEGAVGGKWRIRAVSKSKDGFELRKPLPEAWRGVRDQDLDKLAGIDDCVFVHASGFIGGSQSYAGALAMAKKALDLA